ncbi:MAG: DUF3307 domain-containing protein [Chloroflexi bacterium]|nr:DUF3307 domain-containing protein [Chloroflexota bacterium]
MKDQRLRARNTSTIPWLQRLSFPAYWQWGKLVGGVGLVVLAILLITDHVPHPIIVAVILHLAGDFTSQSSVTALRKHERGRHLLVHALVAGGLPMAITGLVTGNLITTLVWTVIGFVSHYYIDWTRRFGLEGTSRGIVYDQACHLLIILVLVFLT